MNSCQFKFKPDKIKYLTNINTLDSSHSKIVENIIKKRNNLPKKQKKLEKLRNTLSDLDLKQNVTDDYLTIRAKIIEEIEMIDKEIEEINNYDDEIDYFSKTHEILFNYYDLYDGYNNCTNNTISHNDNIINNNIMIKNSENVEEKKNDETKNNINISEQVLKNENDLSIGIFSKVNDKPDKLELLNYISKMKRKEKKVTRKRIKNVESLIKDNNNNIFDYLDSKNKQNIVKNSEQIIENPELVKKDKATLYEDYKILLEGYTYQRKNNKFCSKCNVDKVLIYSEGTYTCLVCGEVENCIVETDITSYKDPMVEKPTFPYKRKNHFCEWTKKIFEILTAHKSRYSNIYILNNFFTNINSMVKSIY